MANSEEDFDSLTGKVLRETGKIPWSELQKFFAQGRAIGVADGVDLVQVAKWMAEDNSGEIARLMDAGDVAVVSDELARDWLAKDTTVWAVVSAPWVISRAGGRCAEMARNRRSMRKMPNSSPKLWRSCRMRHLTKAHGALGQLL